MTAYACVRACVRACAIHQCSLRTQSAWADNFSHPLCDGWIVQTYVLFLTSKTAAAKVSRHQSLYHHLGMALDETRGGD